LSPRLWTGGFVNPKDNPIEKVKEIMDGIERRIKEMSEVIGKENMNN
jgi:hypothetical protein